MLWLVPSPLHTLLLLLLLLKRLLLLLLLPRLLRLLLLLARALAELLVTKLISINSAMSTTMLLPQRACCSERCSRSIRNRASQQVHLCWLAIQPLDGGHCAVDPQQKEGGVQGYRADD